MCCAAFGIILAIPGLMAQVPTELGSAVPPTTDGPVNAVAVIGDTAYIGGSFGGIGTTTGGARFFDATTLVAQDGWPYINGAVLAAIPDGAGGYYVGGQFDRVGGLVRNRVAHLNADKTVDPTFDVNVGPEVDDLIGSPGGYEQERLRSEVDCLLLRGGMLYVGGFFKRVNGWTERWGFAAVDATSGQASAFDPFFSQSGTFEGGYASYADRPGRVSCLEVIGSTLYVGGNFLSVGRVTNPPAGYMGAGQTTRLSLAAYDLTANTLTAWDPNQGQTESMPINFMKAYGTTALVVAGSSVFHPDGSGGGGSTFPLAGQNLAYGVAQLDAQTAGLSNWTPQSPSDGSAVSGFVISGNNLYVAGLGSSTDTQTVWEVNLITGNLLSFDPGTDAATAIGLINGGATLLVGGPVLYGPHGVPHGFAAVDAASGQLAQIQPSEDFSISESVGGNRNFNPSQSINVIAVSGNTVLAGGQIQTFSVERRNNLAAFSISTGKLLPWSPAAGQASTIYVGTDVVYAMQALGSTIYVGGSFTATDSAARTDVAAFDASSGATLPWNPLLDGVVRSMTILGSQIYLAGSFDTVGGQARIGLASVDAASGTVSSWDPATNGVARAIVTDGSLLYAGGYFTTVNNGIARNGLAAFDTAGNVTPFNAGLDANSSKGVLALTLDGGTIYVGGEFSGANSANGTATRNFAASFSTSTGVVTNWNPDLNGSVAAIAVDNGIAYLGGSFTALNVTADNQNIAGLAATRTADGLLTHTSALFRYLDFATGGIQSLTLAGGSLYVGGPPSALPLQTSTYTYTPEPFYYFFPFDAPAYNLDTSYIDNMYNPSELAGSGFAALQLPSAAPGAAAPAIPLIVSSATLGLTTGQPFNFQIGATNGPTAFSINDLPLGLTLNPATGVISGTPVEPVASSAADGPVLRYIVSVGNASGTAYQLFTTSITDPVPIPVIDSALTASGQVGTVFGYNINASNSPTSYGATGLPGGLSVDGGSGIISGTPTTAGTFTVTLSATNAGGTGTSILTLTVVPAPLPAPVISSASTASGQVKQAFSYQITATNSPTSFGASGLPSGLSVDAAGLISGTPTTAGTFTVTLSASSSTGTGTSILTLTVVPAPLPAPVISSASTASGQVKQAFSYQITATNSPTSFGASGLPGGVTVAAATGLISGTPNAAGTFTVTVRATNAGGTGTGTLTLAVAKAPVPVPVITSATTASGQAKEAFSYQITASSAPTGFAATGLPTGLSVDTGGLISGTPTRAGTFTVTLRATNAGGTGTGTLKLKIATAPVAEPVISSALSTEAQQGQAFSYQITASGAPTSFAATGLPAGLSIAADTGLISGTPTRAGTFTVTLRATNAGGTGTGTLTLVVAVATPVINSPLTANAQVGAAFTYQIAGTHNPTSFAATGLPGGLSVAASGLISGTPTQAGTFSVALSAANAGGTGTAALTLVVTPASAPTHPAFFSSETPLGNGVYYLQFPSGNFFGYYSYLADPAYIYHFDLGYEYVFDAADANSGVYLYDFASNGFFYTSPGFPFPYLYDFSLNSVVYYYPDPNNAGRYNTNGVRYFYVFNTGQIISK